MQLDTSTQISDGIEDVSGSYQLKINPAGKIVATWSSFTAGDLNVRSSTAVINLLNLWNAPTTLDP